MLTEGNPKVNCKEIYIGLKKWIDKKHLEYEACQGNYEGSHAQSSLISDSAINNAAHHSNGHGENCSTPVSGLLLQVDDFADINTY